MKPSHSDSQDTSPLTEATYLILLSLVPAPKHGYAIMKDVQSLSEGRVTLSTGTLYGAIKRLLEQEWIERVDETTETEKHPGRTRKSYTLTRMGKMVLNTETNRLQTLVSVAQKRAAEEGT